MNVATEDYLKTIFNLTQQQDRAGTKDIADRLGISQASVTGYLQKLAGSDPPLILYKKRDGASLTEAGTRWALKVIRNHRLIETFLYRTLGYSWDRVHDEACRMEHVISEEFEARIAELLGNPTHDPHGDPIPDRNLHMPDEKALSLAELQPGDVAMIERVSDSDAALLRYLEKNRLVPGKRLTVKERSPFDQNMTLRIHGVRGKVVLGPSVAQQVFVEKEVRHVHTAA
ncbi:MAG: metal-dependent transcriptional regulator [Bacteroidetes bacterium]|nr:metal-dependent transcriptional regulator [Bacteroidota bacterium]